MATINDRYADELIRHAIELERYKNGAAARAIEILNEVEEDLEDLIRRRMRRLTPGRFDAQAKRLEQFLKAVRDQRAAVHLAMRKAVRGELLELSADEVAFHQNAFVRAAQIDDLALVAPVARAVRQAVTGKPFLGQTLQGWFQGLEQADYRRLESAIRTGFIEGETVDQMVRRVRGTRANGFRDGVLQVTRRQAETVVRTGVQHAANQARQELFRENADIIQYEKWMATLDGRTTLLCAGRDGKISPTDGSADVPPELGEPLDPPGARPPAHPNCRSLMVAVISPEGLIGNRPFVVDTSRPQAREVRFRTLAREKAGSKWSDLSETQRRRLIKAERSTWARERVGQVPAETTYDQFLRRQNAGFQDEVLGRTRGALFRRGKLSVDRFTDRTGRRYTLDELRRREPQAFEAANITQE
jgi:SPP1 gp7 family putative phage head morphogenesis protein